MNQVRNLDLLVNLAWVGPHLNRFVADRVNQSHPVLFFNWIPNDLTATGNFSRIHFPMCRTLSDLPVNCDFEVNQLAKIAWTTLKSHAPEAYHVVQQVGLHLWNAFHCIDCGNSPHSALMMKIHLFHCQYLVFCCTCLFETLVILCEFETLRVLD